MTLVGLTMNDPRTGLRVLVLDADERGGRGFELEYTLPQGQGRDAFPAHWHRGWTERFEVLAGAARYRLGRREAELPLGAVVELPPGVVHVHPWSVGDGTLRVCQRSTLRTPDPRAVRETLLAVAMLFWLSREGRVDARGMPAPLAAAPILERLQRGGGYLPGLPVVVQEGLMRALAAWGRRRGHVGFDPACLSYDQAHR